MSEAHLNDYAYGFWQSAEREQLHMVADACRNNDILDIGAGTGSFSDFLIHNGARSAWALEKEVSYGRYRNKINHADRILWCLQTFQEFVETVLHERHFDIGVLSWPSNNDSQANALRHILKRCEKIVYLGLNDGCTQCGTPRLWRYLTTREILVCNEARGSTLIIYGNGPRTEAQPLLKEEMIGMKTEITECGV